MSPAAVEGSVFAIYGELWRHSHELTSDIYNTHKGTLGFHLKLK